MEARLCLNSRWSNSAYNAAYKSQYNTSHHSIVGSVSLPSINGQDAGGFFHWNAKHGMLHLHEESVDYDLVDNTAKFRYGGKLVIHAHPYISSS